MRLRFVRRGRIAHRVEDNGGGGVDGERVDGGGHGNRDGEVETLSEGMREAFSFVADKEGHGFIGERCVGQEGSCFRGRADGEDLVVSECLQEGFGGFVAKDGDTKYATHGGTSGAGMKGIGSTQSDKEIDVKGVGGTDKSADIARIYHVFENKDFSALRLLCPLSEE